MGFVLLALMVAALFYLVATYNALVGGRNGYKNAFAQIDVQLTRRYELIPNLVETAKAYLQHERETLQAVISARNSAVSGLSAAKRIPGDVGAMQQLAGAENAVTEALGRLFALSESYPELKADKTMAQLTEELSSTENRVAYARQAYNDAVMSYNNRREMFPGNLVSGLFAFAAAQSLDIERPDMRAAPKVSFN